MALGEECGWRDGYTSTAVRRRSGAELGPSGEPECCEGGDCGGYRPRGSHRRPRSPALGWSCPGRSNSSVPDPVFHRRKNILGRRANRPNRKHNTFYDTGKAQTNPGTTALAPDTDILCSTPDTNIPCQRHGLRCSPSGTASTITRGGLAISSGERSRNTRNHRAADSHGHTIYGHS